MSNTPDQQKTLEQVVRQNFTVHVKAAIDRRLQRLGNKILNVDAYKLFMDSLDDITLESFEESTLHTYPELKQASTPVPGSAGVWRDTLEEIENMEPIKGVAGCTWGDSEFDSLSVSEGYNQALENVKAIVIKALETPQPSLSLPVEGEVHTKTIEVPSCPVHGGTSSFDNCEVCRIEKQASEIKPTPSPVDVEEAGVDYAENWYKKYPEATEDYLIGLRDGYIAGASFMAGKQGLKEHAIGFAEHLRQLGLRDRGNGFWSKWNGELTTTTNEYASWPEGIKEKGSEV